MTYIETKESYGRTEKVIDARRFAEDLCAELGGVPLKEYDEHDRTSRGAFVLNGATIRVRADYLSVKKGQVAVSIATHGLDWRSVPYPGSSYRGNPYRLPEVNVSVTRPMKQVAADVKRRVIDAAAEPLAALRQYHADTLARREAHHKHVAEARVMLEPHGLEVRDPEGDRAAGIWSRGTGCTYLSASLDAGGRVSIDRIGSITLEQFAAIAKVLSTGA